MERMPVPACFRPARLQCGAASFVSVLVLIVAVAFAALAIDTGRIYFERTRLQEIADIAAVDAVSEAGLCSGSSSLDTATLASQAQVSASRNGYGGDLVAEQAVQTGITQTVNGKRVFTPSAAASANSIEVTTRKTVTNSLFAGSWFGNDTTLVTRAVAMNEPLAGFSIASKLASFDSNDAAVLDALFSGMLGSNVSFTALSYAGIVGTDVSLGDLAAAAGPSGAGITTGSIDELVAAQVGLGEFLNILASAASGSGTAQVALNDMAAASNIGGTFRIGDILAVTSSNPESVADTTLNAFDLMSAGMQIANRRNAVTLPLTIPLPVGSGSVSVDLYVIEPPQYAVGPPGVDASGNWQTQTRTSQLRLQVSIPLDEDLLVARATTSLGLFLEASPASAWLESIHCADSTTLSHQVGIGAQTGIARLGLGQYDDIAGGSATSGNTLTLTPVLGPALNVSIPVADIPVAANSDHLVFNENQSNPLPQTQTVSTSLGSALDTATGALINAIQFDPNPTSIISATQLTNTLLSPVLNNIDELLLEPLFAGVGIHFGGADITLHKVVISETRLVR